MLFWFTWREPSQLVPPCHGVDDLRCGKLVRTYQHSGMRSTPRGNQLIARGDTRPDKGNYA